jgi:hypothetical protein
MNTTTSRIGAALVALTLGLVCLVGGGGCNAGNLGERCNPDLSHDECGSGLSCQQPVNCPENYCCPTSGTTTNVFCQPGCNGGQASICAAGGDADCWELGGDAEPSCDAGEDSMGDGGTTDAIGDGGPG